MFDLGSRITLTFDVIDEQESYATPASVSCTVERPDGSEVVLTPAASSTGRYLASFTATQPGRHVVVWSSSDPACARSDVFNVRAARPLALCSVEDLKRHLNMTEASSSDDDELRGHLEAATLKVEEHRGEVVARRPFVDSVDLSYRNMIVLKRHPVVSVSSIADLDGVEWDLTGWLLDPATGLLTRVGGAGTGPVLIAYQAGYAQVPESFVLAAQIIAGHLWETQRMSHVTNRGATYGDTAPVVGMGYSMPNRAAELLGGRTPNSP